MNRYTIRDEKGRFTKIKGIEKNKYYVSDNKKLREINIRDFQKSLKNAIKMGLTAVPDSNKLENERGIMTGQIKQNTNSQTVNNDYDSENDPLWKSYSETSKPKIIQTYLNDDGEYTTEKPYKFSYRVQEVFGYNDEKQRQLYDIFKEASKIAKELNISTDGKIGREFSTNLLVSAEALSNRLARAKEVLDGSYVDKASNEYRHDFIDFVHTHLADTDVEKNFLKAVNSITPYQFLQVIKNTEMSSFVYAFYVDQQGYEMLVAEIEYLTSAIKMGNFHV